MGGAILPVLGVAAVLVGGNGSVHGGSTTTVGVVQLEVVVFSTSRKGRCGTGSSRDNADDDSTSTSGCSSTGNGRGVRARAVEKVQP